MANPSANKRQKERSRQDKQREKDEKKRERRTAQGPREDLPPGVDPDIAGIVPGPQPIPEDD